MQNKANLPDDQINVSIYITRKYGNIHVREDWKNKAKQSQFSNEPPALFAASALFDVAVYDNKADSLFGRIIRWLYIRCCDETKIGFALC